MLTTAPTAIASYKGPTEWLYAGQHKFPHNKEFLYESVTTLQNIRLSLLTPDSLCML